MITPEAAGRILSQRLRTMTREEYEATAAKYSPDLLAIEREYAETGSITPMESQFLPQQGDAVLRQPLAPFDSEPQAKGIAR